jgi:hypothetical protein
MGGGMSEIDLQQFCSTDPFRPYLHKPFSFGAFTYATSGHIIVRVARRKEAKEGQQLTEEACEKVLMRDAALIFKSLPDFKWPSDKSDEICEACEGRGTEHDCPTCHCPCPDCNGTGFALPQYTISVCGVPFNGRYIKQISALPGFQIAETFPKEGPAPFHFDGGIGAIMPVHDEGMKYLGNIEDAPK